MASVSFLPIKLDINIKKGTDQTLRFQLTDGSSLQGTGGNPIDITLDDIKFTAKDGYAGTCKIATITALAGTHPNPTNGEFLVALSSADTALASSNVTTCWLYEIRRVIGGGAGDEVVYMEGNLFVEPAVGTC